MRSLLVAVCLSASLAGAFAGSVAAAPAQQAVIPSCEELLTVSEAKLAMDEPFAFILRRAVVGSTRICDYTGGRAKSLPSHTVSVEWGPYSGARAQFAKFSRDLCAASKAACGKLETAAKLRPDQKSFLGLEKALAQVGVVKPLNLRVFEGNPAFSWLPSSALKPYGEMAWVFLYVPASRGFLQVRCIDNDKSSPDLKCALQAANFAETSVT